LAEEGKSHTSSVNASGASRVKLAAISIDNTDVVLIGTSSGTINLYDRLDAGLSGASKLEYIGSPSMGTINTSVGSSLSKK